MFEDKAETDANYERCVRLLHDHHGAVRAAFGSHNLRSLAYAITYARAPGIPDTGYEIQMLHGMAEPMHAAMRRLGLRLRVYAPVGELVPGMAYLVRRLLENTSNESFVRHRFAEGGRSTSCWPPPDVDGLPAATPPRTAARDRPGRPLALRRPSRCPSGAGARPAAAMTAAVAAVDGELGVAVPALIARRAGDDARRRIDSVDPGRIPRVVVARAAACGVAEADAAVAAAVEAAEAWAAHARRASAPRCCSGPPTWLRARRARARRARGASRRASRGTRPTPTCARRSTSASTTAARRCASTGPRPTSCSRRRARRTGCSYQGKGVDGGHRAVELPARHPARA